MSRRSIMEQDTEEVREDEETQRTPVPAGEGELPVDGETAEDTDEAMDHQTGDDGDHNSEAEEEGTNSRRGRKRRSGPKSQNMGKVTAGKKKKSSEKLPVKKEDDEGEGDHNVGSQENDDNTITLKVAAQSSTEMFLVVKIRKTASFKKLMKTFCQHFKLYEGMTRFLYDGKRLQPKDTPLELEMENEDMIEVLCQQTGGAK